MELSLKEWIDIALTVGVWIFLAGKTIGLLMAKAEVTATHPADEWHREIEARLAVGNEKFAAIETRFDSAGELISRLATRVQGMQSAIEDRADARYITKEMVVARDSETQRRFDALEQAIRNMRSGL